MGWKVASTGELYDGETHELAGKTWTGKTRTSESRRLEWTNDEPKKKKRARDSKGRLKADDPSTPDINEAWEE